MEGPQGGTGVAERGLGYFKIVAVDARRDDCPYAARDTGALGIRNTV